MDEVVGGIFATVIMAMLLITIVVVWGWVMMKVAVGVRKTARQLSHK